MNGASPYDTPAHVNRVVYTSRPPPPPVPTPLASAAAPIMGSGGYNREIAIEEVKRRQIQALDRKRFHIAQGLNRNKKILNSYGEEGAAAQAIARAAAQYAAQVLKGPRVQQVAENASKRAAAATQLAEMHTKMEKNLQTQIAMRNMSRIFGGAVDPSPAAQEMAYELADENDD